jgi:hypothetical protein
MGGSAQGNRKTERKGSEKQKRRSRKQKMGSRLKSYVLACSLLPSSLYLDHSHCLVLRPATLAALPSTRAIETRSLPTSLAAAHRSFAFYVASPKSSIP